MNHKSNSLLCYSSISSEVADEQARLFHGENVVFRIQSHCFPKIQNQIKFPELCKDVFLSLPTVLHFIKLDT